LLTIHRPGAPAGRLRHQRLDDRVGGDAHRDAGQQLLDVQPVGAGEVVDVGGQQLAVDGRAVDRQGGGGDLFAAVEDGQDGCLADQV
jgi:hypothetical protein